MIQTDVIQRHVIKLVDPQKAMDTVTHPVWRVAAFDAQEWLIGSLNYQTVWFNTPCPCW
jgi:hypothetical protein